MAYVDPKNTTFSHIAVSLWRDVQRLLKIKIGVLKEEARELFEEGRPKAQKTTLAILSGVLGCMTLTLAAVYLLTEVMGFPFWLSFLSVSLILIGVSAGVLYRNEQAKRKEIASRQAALESETQMTQLAIEQKLEAAEAKMKEKVHHLAESLSVRHQVETRPLLMIGGAVAGGLLIGVSMKKNNNRPLREAKSSSFLGKLAYTFEDETQMFKNALVAGLLNAIAQKAAEKMPSMSPYLDPVAESAKRKASMV